MSKTLAAFWTIVVAAALGGLTGASVRFALVGAVFGMVVGAFASIGLIIATTPRTRLTATPIVLGALVISWLSVASLSPFAQLAATTLAFGLSAVAVWWFIPIGCDAGDCPACGYPSTTRGAERVCVECGVPHERAQADRRARWRWLFVAIAIGIGLAWICGRTLG